jgi:glycosyltransferase involved in cell wall biosynthesis
VSDYTRLVARGLARAGDRVVIYAPSTTYGELPGDPGVEVHRLPGPFGPRSLCELDRQLALQPRPDRILVQYVPNAFGYKGMNLPFAAWLASRTRSIAPLWVMFHEVMYPFQWRPAKYALLGAMSRVMARLVAGAADRVFVSIPAWGVLLKRLCPRMRRAEWLPVPCTLDSTVDAAKVAEVRHRLAPPGAQLVGHFGTYGRPVADLLEPALADLLRVVPSARLVLIGRGSNEFGKRFQATRPEFSSRVTVTEELGPADVSAHLRACDLVIQPYPDGVSTRRTSAMAVLTNGTPLVTNLGPLSESLWSNGAVAAAPKPDSIALARLAEHALKEPGWRADLGQRGAALYRETFSLEHTISSLRDEAK